MRFNWEFTVAVDRASRDSCLSIKKDFLQHEIGKLVSI